MNKSKPASASPGSGAHSNSGPSTSITSGNAQKALDRLRSTPSKNNNAARGGVDRRSSNSSSIGGGAPGKRPSSANSQRGNNSVGNANRPNTSGGTAIKSPAIIMPQTQAAPTPPKNITASRPTVSNTSIRSNGNTGNTSSTRPKSTGSGNNNTNMVIAAANTNFTNSSSNNNNNNNKSSTNTSPHPENSKPTTTTPTVVLPKPKTYPTPVSQTRYPNTLSRSLVSIERSRNFRAFIEKAMAERKIFACCGVYPAIRNALKKRGWVEKPGMLAYSRSANATLPNGKQAEDESDVNWMTRVLKEYQPDFLWVIRRDNIDWKSFQKEVLVNRFPKAWFTTKVGLAACLQHMHWFSEAGISDTFFPRCYRLCLEEERQAFQDDYRLTACMSYLRYFVDTFEKKGHAALADVHSKITPLSVDFASRQLGNYIRMRRHEDIDWLLPPNFMTQHWDAFIHQYYAVVHEKKRLRFDTPEAVHVKYETAKKMLFKVAPYWPQIQLDGVYNMWICKPGARSRGKGIVIMNNLEKIMDLMTQSNFRECNWVVQKYIEKPMLIYKTKFDMRQWFLITDWTPLTVWFYKESYARFCTKPFVLENFHESIHLCNNAIQCRYQNAEQRDANLPDENMWSSDTFQAYLKTLGRMDAWPLIYSKMKQAIVGVLLASQENVENKRGCYELYGADFMLTDDFQPWLIEINSCPCMAASTSVTARMCAQCLEDTIKVVVDRRHNKNADTGMFEMIYRQNAGSVAVQQFSGHDLTVIGKKLTRDIDWPMAMSKSMSHVASKHYKSQAILPPQTSPSTTNNNQKDGGSPPKGSKQTLSELLQKLRVRNQEMFQGAIASQQAKTEAALNDEVNKTPRTGAAASGGTTSNGDTNAGSGADRKHNRNTDASNLDMVYRQSASSGGVPPISGHDLAIIGKKLTGDVDWPSAMTKSMANNSLNPKSAKDQSFQQGQGSNNNVTTNDANGVPQENKQTLSELLQRLRVRNQEVFQGALALS